MTTKLAVEVGAVLEEYMAAHRRDAILENRKQKLVYKWQLGKTEEMELEVVIDEEADSREISKSLARVDAAASRIEAMHRLAECQTEILASCEYIEMTQKGAADLLARYERDNAALNAERRVAITYTDQQKSNLEKNREAIKAEFEKIERLQRDMGKYRRAILGEDRVKINDEEIAARLAALRGSRAAAA